jgi:hypothetical protein
MMGRRFFISAKAWSFPTAESMLKDLTNENLLAKIIYNKIGFFMKSRSKKIAPFLPVLILVFLVLPDSKSFAFR